MSLLDRPAAERLLSCLVCGYGLQSQEPDGIICRTGTCPQYQCPGLVVAGQPVLIDFEDSIVTLQDVQDWAYGSGQRETTGMMKRALAGRNKMAEVHALRIIQAVKETEDRRLLVVGGGSVGSGALELYKDEAISVVAFDVYPSMYTQFVADAHRIPLGDASVDAVWIQAVLEHVLDPVRVMSEVRRVLRPEGWLYAETPFMQQVHEGPFDFQRFTASGHRWLMKGFSEIEAGVVAGPATQFLWSIDHLFRAVSRSRTIGRGVKALLFGVRLLDRACALPFALDGASGVYFFGRKSDCDMTKRAIVEYYPGAQAAPRRAES